MKPIVAYSLGLTSGIIATAVFFFWSQRAVPNAATPPWVATSSHEVTASPSLPTPSDSEPLHSVDQSEQALESALKEIQEAGMVVIPQEFARFLMPSLLSTRPEPAVRQILQLDEREAAALAKARMTFDHSLQQAINAHLRVIAVNDGVVTAALPAFKDERQKLIDAWRFESLAALDSDSAAMASHIDFNRGIEGYSQGAMDMIVTFTPSPDARKIAIEYKGQTANGTQRQNFRLQTGLPSSQLSKQFPSLTTHFPQLGEETKP